MKNRNIIIGGRCSGKTAFSRTHFKTGYMVIVNELYAILYYLDNVDSTITMIDKAYKDINPTKYKELEKLGKHLGDEK